MLYTALAWRPDVELPPRSGCSSIRRSRRSTRRGAGGRHGLVAEDGAPSGSRGIASSPRTSTARASSTRRRPRSRRGRRRDARTRHRRRLMVAIQARTRTRCRAHLPERRRRQPCEAALRAPRVRRPRARRREREDDPRAGIGSRAWMASCRFPRPGRTFRVAYTVRLSDADAAGRLRLDAVARYLQDAAIDDVAGDGVGCSGAPLGPALGADRRRRARCSVTARSPS